MYEETDRHRMGLKGSDQYLADLTPLDADRKPAEGGLVWDQDEISIRMAVLVPGLGAVVLRAEFDEAGKAQYRGLSLFTSLQIERGEV